MKICCLLGEDFLQFAAMSHYEISNARKFLDIMILEGFVYHYVSESGGSRVRRGIYVCVSDL